MKSTIKNFTFTLMALAFIAFGNTAFAQSITKTAQDANGYTYTYVEGDPMDVKIYTLENGLSVYLAENHDEPRIQTLIPVRAGSKFDPSDNTGLAHYLEHMMFKGTDILGTSNWEEEKVLLEQISNLYEAHKAETDPAKKKAIYAQIDSVSNVASGFAIPNEYDKIISQIGGKSTNAYTSFEETVYMNNIPANELERWVKLESERFSQLVLRLFHTELEAVYEEFNIGQDNDARKQYFALLDGLFPSHQYGQQSTIGTAEHLKNPSMEAIHNYWDTYYRANNMAVCLSGDFKTEEAIKIIADNFGSLPSNPNIPTYTSVQEKPITSVVEKHVYGPERESVMIGFRLDGYGSEDEYLGTLLSEVLSNGKAGLIDLDLVQSQKVLDAGASMSAMNDYGMFYLVGTAREGQSLEEVKDLLLAELEKVKNGEMADWMLDAISNNFRLSEIRQAESNYKVFNMVEAFISEQPWEQTVKFLDKVDSYTQEDLQAFAKEKFTSNNYVVVYKNTGVDSSVVKVEKPEITSVQMNREATSKFVNEFNTWESAKLNPVFVDFNAALKQESLNEGIDLAYIKNVNNELAQVVYVFEMGRMHDKELPIAVDYLDYLGTDKYTSEQLKQEFYKLGLSIGVNSGEERCYVSLRGLDKNLEKGIELLEELMANAKADAAVYEQFSAGQVKERSNAMLSKNNLLWGGLYPFGKYGTDNPNRYVLSNEEMLSMDPEALVKKVAKLYNYEHTVFYYGPREMKEAKSLIVENHKMPKKAQAIPEMKKFEEQATKEPVVYFLNYDMVQTNIVMLSKDQQFDAKLMPQSELFNEYYGSGLSSVVFQEIREARGLAYTAFASYSEPSRADQSNYVVAFVGTQADKMKDAMKEMKRILDDVPQIEYQFEASKQAIQSKIESERIMKSSIFWTYMANKKMGLDYDYRKDIYEFAQNATLEQMDEFFSKHVENKTYAIMVMGNKELLNMEELEALGKVVEIQAEDLFNY